MSPIIRKQESKSKEEKESNEQQKFNFVLEEEEKKEIYNNLNDEYNIENIGINYDKFNSFYKEFVKQCKENITKEDFIEDLNEFIMYRIF